MFDAFGLPQPTEDGMVQWFTGTSTGQGAASRQGESIWFKPRGARFVSIFAIGAGGTGGFGATRTAGSAGGGGGGGGSASVTHNTYLAAMLPDSLYVHAAANDGTGTPGISFVSVYEMSFASPTAQNLVILSGNPATPAANGGNGSSGTAGAGGSGGAAASPTVSCLMNLSLNFFSFAGQTGASGGAQTGAVGGSVAFATGYVTAGAGGGGTTSGDFAGGNITGTASTMQVTSSGGVSGSNGASGFIFPAAIARYGGSGGGSANSAAGGNGGAGATYGAGGGGGGAGTTGGTGGIGGPGLVVIQCW